MAVTITTNTLSPRVRYLNVSPSTVNADAKSVVLAVANALIDLGWSRYDTAGETSVVGTDDNAGVILRRQCYDFADSGHYNYLGIRIVGSGNNAYAVYFTQAAGWSSTTSMSAFVNAASVGERYTANSTAPAADWFNFLQGGTIWLFDSGKTLLVTVHSGSRLTKARDSIWVFGEYKKEFGENVDTATGYIHNGVMTNNKWLFSGSGVNETYTSRHQVAYATLSASYYNSQGSYNIISLEGHGGNADGNVGTKLTGSGSSSSTTHRFSQSGNTFPQFSLTEAPAASATNVYSRAAIAPVSCGLSFTTRLLMGYLGYVGHISPYCCQSINSAFGANPHTTTHNAGWNTNAPNNTTLFSAASGQQYTLSHAVEEYSPHMTTLRYNIFEPTMSCGTTSQLGNFVASSYTGPQYKFSALGRIFDMKIFGPYTNEKYSLLDSMTIPCDADGFYSDTGTDKEFWIIPSELNTSLVMPK